MDKQIIEKKEARKADKPKPTTHNSVIPFLNLEDDGAGNVKLAFESTETPIEPEGLSAEEKASLTRNEAIIDQHQNEFIDVCLALYTIRTQRLFRATHGSFAEYCKERFGFSRAHAYRHAQVGEEEIKRRQSQDGDTSSPASEGEARRKRKARQSLENGVAKSQADKPTQGKSAPKIIDVEVKTPKDETQVRQPDQAINVIPMIRTKRPEGMKSWKEFIQMLQQAIDIAGDLKQLNEQTEILSELIGQAKLRAQWEDSNIGEAA